MPDVGCPELPELWTWLLQHSPAELFPSNLSLCILSGTWGMRKPATARTDHWCWLLWLTIGSINWCPCHMAAIVQSLTNLSCKSKLELWPASREWMSSRLAWIILSALEFQVRCAGYKSNAYCARGINESVQLATPSWWSRAIGA